MLTFPEKRASFGAETKSERVCRSPVTSMPMSLLNGNSSVFRVRSVCLSRATASL